MSGGRLNVLYHFSIFGRGLVRMADLVPVVRCWPFVEGGCAVILCCLFFCVEISVTFGLVCVNIIIVRFGLLGSCHLGCGCSLGWSCVPFVLWLFVVLVVSHFGFGARFGFW